MRIVEDLTGVPSTPDGFPHDVAFQDNVLLSGGGDFVLATQITVSTIDANHKDVNGDGWADLVWRNTSNGAKPGVPVTRARWRRCAGSRSPTSGASS